MTEARLERLESKIAYLENANQTLSDILYRQQRELDDLRELLRACQQQLRSWKDDAGARSLEEERPPHY